MRNSCATRRLRLCLALLPALLPALLMTSPAAEAQLRGIRYCEVLAVYARDGALQADVWNSLSAGNLCPQEQWELLDADTIRGELGALNVGLNGPRHWILDFISGSEEQTTGELRDFGGIAMRLVATVDIASAGGTGAYTNNSVNRDTQFLFRDGREIYELTDPDGRIYIMQSWSQIVDPDLDEADLPLLGSRLVPQECWTFSVRTLDHDHVVDDQNGVATVIQDELQNSYQYSGFIEEPAARSMKVKNKASGPQQMALVARDATIVAHESCDVDGDLVIESRGAGADALRVQLETVYWRPIRQDQPEQGCRYDAGPVVRQLRIRDGELRIKAAAADLGVPLSDNPAPVRIRLRHGERNYCFTFGGDVKHRAGKRLSSRNAPAGGACPSTPLIQ